MKQRVWALAAFLAVSSSLVWSQDNRPQGSEFEAVPTVMATGQLPEFEVADIAPSKAGGQTRAQFLPGGKIQFQSLPVKFMVLAAWGYETDEGRVKGGPSWINSDQYDIVAKARPDTKIATLRLMLRSLLMKRFGLEVHVEDAMLPVYALEKGKVAPKLTASATDGKLECNRSFEDPLITMTCQHITMDELANGLRSSAPAYFDKPVVNMTGMTGQFDFKLGWTPRGRLSGEGRGSAASATAPDGAASTPDPASAGLTVFEAVEKYLGLKLTSTKQAIPIVVIDKINRTPVDN